MRKTKKLASLLLVIALLGTLLPTSLAGALTATPQDSDPIILLEDGSYVPGQLLIGIVDAKSVAPKNVTAAVGSSILKADADLAVDLFADAGVTAVEDLTDLSDLVAEVDSVKKSGIQSSALEAPSYEGRQILLVELAADSEEDLLETIQLLEQNPLVAYAEPNYVVESYALPEDSYFNAGYLWGMEKIQAPLAWDIETGSHSVMVGVLDTGVDYTHPELSANVDIESGYNFVDDDTDPTDDHGHGTHVAGTIGAVGDNATGVVGVNWNVTIVPLKIMDSLSSGGTEARLIQALLHAERIQLPIINLSAGIVPAHHGGTYLDALREALENYSGLLVASTGNTGADNDNELSGMASYPAAFDCDNIIAVAASDERDNLCDFSAYGRFRWTWPHRARLF